MSLASQKLRTNQDQFNPVLGDLPFRVRKKSFTQKSFHSNKSAEFI